MRKRNSYHSNIKIAAFFDILPYETKSQIPKSTLYRFKNTDPAYMFGYELNSFLEDNIGLIRQFVKDRKAFACYRAVIRIKTVIVKIKDRIINTACGFSRKQINQKIIQTINRVKDTVGLDRACRYFNITVNRYYAWIKQGVEDCSASVLNICPRVWPNQLTKKETNIIKTMLQHKDFKGWPIYSVAVYALRQGILFASPGSWYKYAKKLGISRKQPRNRHKKDKPGIRADRPNAIWHADVTVFRTMDNVRTYIYLLVDNYSRCILSWRASLDLSGDIRMETIREAYNRFIKPVIPEPPVDLEPVALVVDGGPENNCTVIENFLNQSDIYIKKTIAQKDMLFSNSIVEAANKLIKYRWLFINDIPDFASLERHLDHFIPTYNKIRPHTSLKGLTPYEVYSGKPIESPDFSKEFLQAHKKRIEYNRNARCPGCTN